LDIVAIGDITPDGYGTSWVHCGYLIGHCLCPFLYQIYDRDLCPFACESRGDARADVATCARDDSQFICELHVRALSLLLDFQVSIRRGAIGFDLTLHHPWTMMAASLAHSLCGKSTGAWLLPPESFLVKNS
jgi:hypothetical protein